jgi:cytochrome c oxidase cbb3-type subunit 3
MTDNPESASPSRLREHEFDGIQEFDNRLPNWWLWTFYGACIFSFFYWIYYHSFPWGRTPLQEFRAEQAAIAATASSSMFTDDELRLAAQDAAVIAEGKTQFTANCLACHAADGGGMIGSVPLPGPNLTDNAWIHGGSPTAIFKTIWDGVPEKGMVTWGPQLGKDRIRAVVAYLLTLRNTNVAGGKPPEGQAYEGN